MRGLQKSKRVSWASDVNLCQVRLFLSEESPSQVGLGAQDHLQAKASWLSHPAGTAADDILPPGFEGGHPATNNLHIKLSDIPVIKWRCPPRFVLDLTWQVVAAEESKEVEIQNQREMRVLEAVYPRPTAIPPNPSFSSDTEDSCDNDHQVPLIPITPIEDEDATDVAPDLMGTLNVPMSSQSQLRGPGIVPEGRIHNISNILSSDQPAAGSLGVEPDVVATASASFAAINKSSEQGSLIDPDLLIKILNNPKLIEKLIQDHGAASNVQNTPKPTPPFVPLSDPLPPPPTPPVSVPDPSYLLMNRTETSTASSFTTATSNGPFYAQPNGAGPAYLPNVQVPLPAVPASPASSVGVPRVKDMNYYKNLIQQHGGERQETPHQYNSRYGHHQIGMNQEIVNPKSRDSKPKIMKPCIYFNSSRGCRHGANCAYQHDTPSQQRSSSISEVQTAKRMKMDREISS